MILAAAASCGPDRSAVAPEVAGARDGVRAVQADRAALAAMYNALGGPGWTRKNGWLTDAPLAEWENVSVRDDGRVSRLKLSKNNLRGELPPEAGDLEGLQALDLSYNPELAGALPSALGGLVELRRLPVNNTSISGNFPDSLAGLKKLEFLDAANTKMKGVLPLWLQDLSLRTLWFYRSALCLPREMLEWLRSIENEGDRVEICFPVTPDREALRELYEATGGEGWKRRQRWLTEAPISQWQGVEADSAGFVTRLSLVGKGLDGELPSSIWDLSRLRTLVISNNENLRGEIPEIPSTLEALDTLTLTYNGLSGLIPASISQLPALRVLWLFNNALEGPIPPQLGELSRLEELSLSDNAFGAPIPPELGNLTKLRLFQALRAEITGGVPKELGSLGNLEALWLSGNPLAGPIPSELGQLKKLEWLYLGHSDLSGPLPKELGGLESLVDLGLYDASLEGPIPPELGALAKLESMQLSGNRLTGPLPKELGALASLKIMDLRGNRVSGALPSELGRLRSLERLYLGRNSEIDSTIPWEFGRLSRLKELDLAETGLTGSIPEALWDIETLELLDLNSTGIDGRLSAKLCRGARSLGRLWISSTRLKGVVPACIRDKRILKSFHSWGTGLCVPRSSREMRDWAKELAEPRSVRFCDDEEVERLALAGLFEDTDGEGWSNARHWGGPLPPSAWHGVSARRSDGRVVALDLRDNGLAGALSHEIAHLSELRSINLSGNDLAGGVPREIAHLAELRGLDLSRNGLAGVLPRSMKELRGLRAFNFADTELCASPAPSFQRWLRGLWSHSGRGCENVEEVKVRIPWAYLIQSVQSPGMDTRLIAGRDALLRVFVVADRDGAFFEPEVVATFFRDGRRVFEATAERRADLLSVRFDESRLEHSHNAVIPGHALEPGTELVVELRSGGIPLSEGSSTRFPESGRRALEVIRAPPMRLTVVPVLEAVDPDSSALEWVGGIDGTGEQTAPFRNSFPFGEFTARPREPYYTGLDLTSDGGQWELVLEMELLRAVDGETGYYYGVGASRNGYVRGRARLGGWASIGKPWPMELAHEVGHSLNLVHAPCGGVTDADPDFPHVDGAIGVWGYDFGSEALVDPVVYRDFMGYCYRSGLNWLSDWNYEKVIDYREEAEGGGRAAFSLDEGSAAEKERSLILRGGVLDGELRLLSPLVLEAAPQLPTEAGSYRVDLRDAAGRALRSLAFEPDAGAYGDSYFFFAVPLAGDLAERIDVIQLEGPEGFVQVGADDSRPVTIVRDPATGSVRALLKGPPPEVFRDRDAGRYEVQTTASLREAMIKAGN